MKRFVILACMLIGATHAYYASACTGITLSTTSHQPVTARTIEWSATPLHALYVAVPRDYRQRSFLPDGTQRGSRFVAKYGYVGIAVEQPEFIMEGINEAGLAAGLFYFPEYGQYESYKEELRDVSVSDMQLVAWILSNCATIDQVQDTISHIRIIATDPRASTVHWRITEPSGRQVVLEIVDQQLRFHENPLGVLTNSPSLSWHLTNLNNYVNLSTGSIPARQVGSLDLSAFGGGSGMHGLPGDMTPPSRFVRAAFFAATAPQLSSTETTVTQAFHILNNFDIPIGIQFADSMDIPPMPSATQVTIATDLTNRLLYFRTMYNANIRVIDLRKIDFAQISYQFAPLDLQPRQPFQVIAIQ